VQEIEAAVTKDDLLAGGLKATNLF